MMCLSPVSPDHVKLMRLPTPRHFHSAATLNDGDHIRICDHEFTFRIAAGNQTEG